MPREAASEIFSKLERAGMCIFIWNKRNFTNIDSELPFEEITLWRIFDCLVDACSILEFGQELTYDDVSKVAKIARPIPGIDQIVHLDIKPENGVC